MTRTTLPQHLDSLRRRLYRKHVIIVERCYPRRGTVPGSSELSYLLFYASSRRSKLPKIGAYLEGKTSRDVYYAQSARVTVTLQIMAALLENKSVGEGSGFALIAPYFLRILLDILNNTNDISLIEASTPTWNVLCMHQDQALLAAEHTYRELYERVVARYAHFAEKSGAKKLGKATQPVAAHDAIRLREAGLRAIKSVLSSDALAFESGRQLLTGTIPAVLSNIRSEEAALLDHLVQLSKSNENEEKEKAIPRRQSITGARTLTGELPLAGEADPRAAEGTTQDADALAEEEVAVLALDCLKAVFSSDNRAQIRAATSAVLNYLSELQYYTRPSRVERDMMHLPIKSWSAKLFGMCVGWTPVQDRFILLVTVVERLAHLPLKERDQVQHILHLALIDRILVSDLNLIGLSVMDVLLGLIQHTLRILHAFPPSTEDPAMSPAASGSDDLRKTSSRESGKEESQIRMRHRLVIGLQDCIADLATHIYYSDQVSDMVSTLLKRVKPTPVPLGPQNTLAASVASEQSKAISGEGGSEEYVAPRERTPGSPNGSFNHDTARLIALENVKNIIKTAHSSRAQTTQGAHNRAPVHISIWDGTQWLLRDPCKEVRMAYTDALVTWLELETKKNDFRLESAKAVPGKKHNELSNALARRAASNASATKDGTKRGVRLTSTRQQFLQLLHLANYENALTFASDPGKDILTTEVLLISILEHLGMNAVMSGLPMIFALQDKIPSIPTVEGRVKIGTLVHGYLWAVIEAFGCGEEVVAKAVLGECARREAEDIWYKGIRYPPLRLPTIKEMDDNDELLQVPKQLGETVDLRPFLDREQLVDCIIDHYRSSSASTPALSAPSSPGRASLDRSSSSYLSAKGTVDVVALQKAKTAMMSNWSREECLAHLATLAPRSVSVEGSNAEEDTGATGEQEVKRGREAESEADFDEDSFHEDRPKTTMAEALGLLDTIKGKERRVIMVAPPY